MISRSEIGAKILDIIASTGIIATKSEGRRLIQQNGLYLGDTKVTDIDLTLTADALDDNSSILIRKGKKSYHRIIVE